MVRGMATPGAQSIRQARAGKGLRVKPRGQELPKTSQKQQSSAKISKISRNARKSSRSDIFYLLTIKKPSEISSSKIFFFREVSRSFCPLRFYPPQRTDPSVLKIVWRSNPYYFAITVFFSMCTVFLPLFPRKTSTSDSEPSP